ncbi:MAG: radical SAM protein [Spirochaetia bacterium]|nr:radical SAM protein [Spirochaetia bacterium]
MKHALLVNPWVYDFKCHDFWIKPYGLLRIAALLKNNGLKVTLIDCMDRLDPDAPEEFKKSDSYGIGAYYSEEIQKIGAYERVPRKYKRYGLPVDVFHKKLDALNQKPDIIFMTSGMTYTYEGVQLASRILKERYNAPQVLGGIYATLCREHAQRFTAANYIWTGDINNYFLMMVNRAAGVRIDSMEDREFNELVPDYSLYPKLDSVAVKFTKGCPYSCSYCAIKSFCEGYYQRDPQAILKELDTYKERGIKNIAFYDDALLYKNVFIKGILKEAIKRGYGFNFHTPNGLHAAYLDAETARLMKEAGFADVRVSLESSDYAIQKQTGNKVSNEAFRTAVDNLRKAGFEDNDIGVYILAGIPGQTFASVMKDVEYLKKMNLKIKIANYSPIPGTVDFLKIKPEFKAELMREPQMQNELYFMQLNSDYDRVAHLKVKAEIDGHNNTIKDKGNIKP